MLTGWVTSFTASAFRIWLRAVLVVSWEHSHLLLVERLISFCRLACPAQQNFKYLLFRFTFTEWEKHHSKRAFSVSSPLKHFTSYILCLCQSLVEFWEWIINMLNKLSHSQFLQVNILLKLAIVVAWGSTGVWGGRNFELLQYAGMRSCLLRNPVLTSSAISKDTCSDARSQQNVSLPDL